MKHKLVKTLGREKESFFSLVCACVYAEANFRFGPQVPSTSVLFEADRLAGLGLSS